MHQLDGSENLLCNELPEISDPELKMKTKAQHRYNMLNHSFVPLSSVTVLSWSGLTVIPSRVYLGNTGL